MMMPLKQILFTGFLLAAAACAGGKVSRHSVVSEEERVFRATCLSCHSLPEPSSRAAEDWEEILSRHAEMFDIQQADREKILRFLRQEN